MKLVVKLLLLASLSVPVGASAATYFIVNNNNHKENDVQVDFSSSAASHSMSAFGYTFKIDNKTLMFTIKKGDKTWGIVDTTVDALSSDEKIAFLESPLTVTYCDDTGSADTDFYVVDRYTPLKSTIDLSTIEFKEEGNVLSASATVTCNDIKNKPSNPLPPLLVLSFTINYQLMEDGLKISVSDISEGEEGTRYFSKLSIYPGFNASYMKQEGYFLIPDGSGALIDLNTDNDSKGGLTLTTYGKDIGIYTSDRNIYSPEQVSMPMYAMYDNEKTMFATVEEGDEHSELRIEKPSISGGTYTNRYNDMYYRFTYRDAIREYYGTGDKDYHNIVQENRYEMNPTIRYHLIDESMDYTGLAKKYQEYLLDNDLLNDTRYKGNNVRLEFLMADNKKALFGKELVKMTTANFVREKVSELASEHPSSYSVSIRGYTQGGFNGSYPYTFPIEGQTGSSGEYKKMAISLKELGVNVNYNVDLLRSFTGDNKKNALNVSQKLISSSDYVNGTNMTFYRLNPKETLRLLDKYENNLSNLEGYGFDFTSIGYDLYSTYYHEKSTRKDTMNKYISGLSEFSHERSMRKPNQYMFKYFEQYLDAPTSSSGYLIESKSVPFLQMVLSGYKSFASSPINLNYLGKKQLLNLLEYNISPSYILTEEDSVNLLDSPASSYIYSSVFDVWENDIKEAYDIVVSKQKQIEGELFVNHEYLANNVVKNTYETKCIVINYTSNPYVYEGKEIAPLSSEVFTL